VGALERVRIILCVHEFEQSGAKKIRENLTFLEEVKITPPSDKVVAAAKRVGRRRRSVFSTSRTL
jgi:hypothetical protein